jgi:hypothetical protein
MTVPRFLVIATAVVALCTIGLGQSVAAAASNPVSAGEVRIILAKRFSKLLADHHVRVLTRGGASRQGNSLVLPATGGQVEPAGGGGNVEADGSIVFARGRRQLPFRHLRFEAKRTPLLAKVGGSQLKVATAGRIGSGRDGFGTVFTATGLRLTAKVTARLDKKLGLDGALHEDELIGRLKAKAQPATLHLLQGQVGLIFDREFVGKLDARFVSLNPIAPAALSPGPTLSFPIGAESTLSPGASAGTLKLGGAVELLQLGNAQLFWREIWVQPALAAVLTESDLEPSPPLPGRQAQGPSLSLQADGTVVSDPVSRTINLTGKGVALTAATADTLNKTFCDSEEVFKAGELVASLSIFARVR